MTPSLAPKFPWLGKIKQLVFNKFGVFWVQVSLCGAIGEVCLKAPQDIYNALCWDK